MFEVFSLPLKVFDCNNQEVDSHQQIRYRQVCQKERVYFVVFFNNDSHNDNKNIAKKSCESQNPDANLGTIIFHEIWTAGKFVFWRITLDSRIYFFSITTKNEFIKIAKKIEKGKVTKHCIRNGLQPSFGYRGSSESINSDTIHNHIQATKEHYYLPNTFRVTQFSPSKTYHSINSL